MSNPLPQAGEGATALAGLPPIYVTDADHGLLSGLVGSSDDGPPGAALLRRELERAILVMPGEFPAAFVKLGSAVRYEDAGKARTVSVVLPQAADIDENRVSVFSPVGAALFGLTAGQVFALRGQDGRTRLLRVLAVDGRS
jgi:regulator of nucleoside diphosphate kinase